MFFPESVLNCQGFEKPLMQKTVSIMGISEKYTTLNILC